MFSEVVATDGRERRILALLCTTGHQLILILSKDGIQQEHVLLDIHTRLHSN